jgi:ADP-ribosylglycohydrolase
MRIAPVGLFDCQHLEKLRKDVHSAGAITHGNPEALAGGLAVAYGVARLATAEVQPERLIAETIAFVGDCDVSRNLRHAHRLLEGAVPAADALITLGTSGYVVHTVASAFYCFARTPESFKQTVIEAVMAGGDTDTTGAVAGALSGAYNGAQRIPAAWLEQVEGRAQIEELARRICAVALGTGATEG